MNLMQSRGSAEGGDGSSSSELARSGAEAGASVCLQSSPHRTQKSFATASIALSLRVRESDSMSLKHIFEQRRMGHGGLCRPEDECRPNPPEQPTRGLEGAGNPPARDLRNRGIPELDLTFRKAQASLFANAGAGFGSPVSTLPAPANQEFELMSSLCIPQKQHNPHATPVASARLPPPAKPTAQMTIFYSGNVNVYHDVPAEEAHAIMVLASSMSSNSRCPSSSTVAAVAGPASACTEMKQQERTLSPMKAALLQPETPPPLNSDYANEVGITKDLPNLTSAASPLPGSPMASPPPSTGLVSLAESAREVQGEGVQGRRLAELPHARKASLMRFLEKRKDRVVPLQNLGADQQGSTGEEGEGNGGRNVSSIRKPGNASNALTTSGKRLPSPAATWQDTYNSSSREKFCTPKRSRADDEHDSSSLRNISLKECAFLH